MSGVVTDVFTTEYHGTDVRVELAAEHVILTLLNAGPGYRGREDPLTPSEARLLATWLTDYADMAEAEQEADDE